MPICESVPLWRSTIDWPLVVVRVRLTFWGGPRACIGWRLAVIETQIFLIEIISRFEVSLSEKATRIRREACGIVVPTVEGEVEKGVQLSLIISVGQQ
ncbi:hypothetical protein EDD17DRAFT_1480355 [Pisolithus thermaeus]|nr:hypothetical protein EV401DRAFT_1851179 [Pisolithus croceorrhizus]KAI6161778.1 hypothetical protein EDD17DRAFT_1480355 [Pisolithus thermaeus]